MDCLKKNDQLSQYFLMEFFHPVTVYLEDTDAGGIVYHANYLKYMERGRTEFFSQLGFAKPALLDGGLLLVVHSMNIQFIRAAKLADRLQVGVKLNKLARTYVNLLQNVSISGADAQQICEAEVKIACVNRDTLKPCAMPDDLRQVLSAYI
jgi:4-hydroxybenzoyl-CoA thioesterase